MLHLPSHNATAPNAFRQPLTFICTLRENGPAALAIFPTVRFLLILPQRGETLQLVWMDLSPPLIQSHTGRLFKYLDRLFRI